MIDADAGSVSEGASGGSLFDVKNMDQGKSEELTFQTWKDDVQLIVGKIDKDFTNTLQEASKAVGGIRLSQDQLTGAQALFPTESM